MRFTGRAQMLAVPVAALLLAAAALLLAFNFNPTARRVPLVVGVPTLILAIATVVVEAVRLRRLATPGATATSDDDQSERGGSDALGEGAFPEIKVFATFALLAVCSLLFGFPIGAALFMVTLLLVLGRRRWLPTVLITVGVIAPLYLIFAQRFRVPAFRGWLL